MEKISSELNSYQPFSFSVATFNILCPYWNSKKNERGSKEVWSARQHQILDTLQKLLTEAKSEKKETSHVTEKTESVEEGTKKQKSDEEKDKDKASNLCDIICLQEFWCDNEDFVKLYEQTFQPLHYELYYFKRTEKISQTDWRH
ncbi:hypothetical protein RFI_22323 [Reticulomyxa filosa]|uniref:Endonuclease/exonuclease/phosphatase domain-containing protein n=1 Tax=Reticulomyxa filosa TaxID=46433 RepID=X6MPM3_RETFI|nr:hypothetical protein RFI_22323 [Reticulomyxa filosa]|eukprot:ETO15040.1 hypothetical protein RFI_22323 [Reticulomyxa filosa]